VPRRGRAAARQTQLLAEPGADVRVYAFLYLALSAGARGEPEEAVRHGRDALDEIDVLDDRLRPGFLLDVASVFEEAGYREEARATLLHGSDEARRLGDPLVIAVADAYACSIDLLEQRYAIAEAGFRSVLRSCEVVSNAAFEVGFSAASFCPARTWQALRLTRRPHVFARIPPRGPHPNSN